MANTIVFNFVFDKPSSANLAEGTAMDTEYPYIVPLRLLYFCQDHNYPYTVSYIDDTLPDNAYYPVGIGWFDFSQDYFAKMSDRVKEYLREKKLKVLFYYHEGDNPYHEKTYLDSLCKINNLPADCYKFVSGNTKASEIPGFVYFPDHELFYWRNAQTGAVIHDNVRAKQFTMLSRFHKWWRATVTAYLHRGNFLKHSYWSYNNIDMGDKREDNPINVSLIDGLDRYIDKFLAGAPYTCDTLSSDEHNSHWILVPELYENSYCSIVLETLYDAEQCGGAFITEKTFKAIRNGHPFVIFGCPNSLSVLRSLGYKTFDYAIDNEYDIELDNTKRLRKTARTIRKLLDNDMYAFYQQCKADLIYNQKLFMSSKYNRLEELAKNLNAV